MKSESSTSHFLHSSQSPSSPSSSLSSSSQVHWDNIYMASSAEQLGWYEDKPWASLELLAACELQAEDGIFIAGAGSSTLVDVLTRLGYKGIIAADISSAALASLRERLGPESAQKVQWIHSDLRQSHHLVAADTLKVWHDRAVFHFVCDADEQQQYVERIHNSLQKGAYAIMAVFGPDSPATCSGLPVHCYSLEAMVERMGSGFELVEAFSHDYHMPNGDSRDYLYTLFKKL